MTALRRPDKLRRFRDGMCAVVGMVRKKKNMELQWGRSIAAGITPEFLRTFGFRP